MFPFWIVFLVFHCISLPMGIANNTFMAAVTIIQCARSRQMPTSCHLLLLALALNNIPLQCCMSGEPLVCFLWHEVYYRLSVWKNLFVLFPILALSSFWINSCLCVFSCATIVNLSHPLFVNLKWRIISMVAWFLLSSTLASLPIGFSVIWYLGTPPPGNYSANTTSTEVVTEYCLFHKVLMGVMGCFVPVVVILISAVLVLRSLYRHTRQMQQNNTGFTSGPSIAVHKRAANTILSLLALYICFDVSLIFGITDSTGYAESAKFYLTESVCILHSFMNSLTLISGNTKLKSAALRIFCGSQH